MPHDSALAQGRRESRENRKMAKSRYQIKYLITLPCLNYPKWKLPVAELRRYCPAND